MASSSSSFSSTSSYATNSPCAACKFLRRKCLAGCVFAPYFPPEEPTKFANVHKIFGASNVSKLLNEISPHQREDAVNSLAYEAEARLKDPVYGCVGAISVLQRQVIRLQKELEATNADLMRYTNDGMAANTMNHHHQMMPHQQQIRMMGYGGGSAASSCNQDQNYGMINTTSLPYSSYCWNSGPAGSGDNSPDTDGDGSM